MAQKVRGATFLTGADLNMNTPDKDGNVGYLRPSSQPDYEEPKGKKAPAKKAAAKKAPAAKATDDDNE